jgi:hypothetical protein
MLDFGLWFAVCTHPIRTAIRHGKHGNSAQLQDADCRVAPRRLL